MTSYDARRMGIHRISSTRDPWSQGSIGVAIGSSDVALSGLQRHSRSNPRLFTPTLRVSTGFDLEPLRCRGVGQYPSQLMEHSMLADFLYITGGLLGFALYWLAVHATGWL